MAALLTQKQPPAKVPCPTCGRKVKAMGLAQHIDAAHGELGEARRLAGYISPRPSLRVGDIYDSERLLT